MEFDPLDRLAEIAEELDTLITAADELANDPPPSLKTETIEALREVLAKVSQVVSKLEEQREAGPPTA